MKMKTYKILLGGRGAELMIHNITEDQKTQLQEMDVEELSKEVDWEKLNEVLGVENIDDTDEIYIGTHFGPDSYHIQVFDEQDNLVWESDKDFFIDEGEEMTDTTFIERENILLVDNGIKGTFKEYKLETEEDFDPNKLSYKSVEINEESGVLTDLKYNNKDLEIEEWGDYWSKGTFFTIF